MPLTLAEAPRRTFDELVPELRAFGWTSEAVDILLMPMIKTGNEGLGSMGNDAPLACMSDRPRLIYGACTINRPLSTMHD